MKKVSRESWITGLGASIPGLAYGSIGAGVGLLGRARFEKKMLKDSEKTTKDKAMHYLPHIGAAAGFAVGFKKGLGAIKIIDEIANLDKISSLKKEVQLRDHQNDAINTAKENNGSLLIAHATGTGKTLTGIATFEKLKEEGKAKRAVVVVPASLRSNFVNKGVKAFTNSSVNTYGPKNEANTKNIGDKSNADYNVISYDLFREHGDKIIEDTGADTLIMDEVHRARATEGTTYNKLRDLRAKMKNAITLTGSIVNNQPNDVVPLLDITYNPTGHRLVSKDFFDKLFVKKDAKTSAGFLSAKTIIDKKIINKPQLAKYLGGKIHYVAHDEVEKYMPGRKLIVEEVGMSQPQKDIYDFSMSSVDPITRWKIRNSIPVGQKEAKDAFAKLLQARQVSTDPGILSKELASHPDPASYSPKIRKVVEDLENHIKDKDNKTVVFGNLLEGQLKSVEKSLKHRGIPYSTFFGVGNEGNSAKKRDRAVENFQKGDSQVLLISGAGAEGLDLKNANMMQVLEGHYNPERIQQAEARVRRMGAPIKEVTIKRYITTPKVEGQNTFIGGIKKILSNDRGVDHWIYQIAKDKDTLNSEFRDVLKSHEKTAFFEERDADMMRLSYYGTVGGSMLGHLAAIPINKSVDQDAETIIKQRLLDKGYEQLTGKKHFKGIMAESKADERAIDAIKGAGLIGGGLSLVNTIRTLTNNLEKTKSALQGIPTKPSVFEKVPLINQIINPTTVRSAAISGAVLGAGSALATPLIRKYLNRAALSGDNSDLDKGIELYREKQLKKARRKYKSSKGYVQEYETKEELGIEHI